MALPEQPDAATAWRSLKSELRSLVGDSAFEIWLAPLQLESWDGELLLVRAPEATEKWLTGRFGPVLQHCAREAFGPRSQVAFAGASAADTKPVGAPAGRPAHTAPTVLHPRYRFEQFVIGEGNRLAHAAALAVAELPGQAYNPLFLYAPPGLGKTHLLQAIGNYVLAFGAGATVRYTTAEAFTNHFITALGSRSVDAFKRAYRDVDVLLIDDVQFLASKARTEEEFFHTINALHERGRQLVLTCDRLPRALVSVEQRLRERFEAGLVADIQPPDRATRVTILRKRAALDGVVLADPTVLDLIADRVTENVRALEGALIRVVAMHSLTQRPIDHALATEVLDVMYPGRRPRVPSIAEVQAIVAGHFDLTVEQLTSATRTRRVAWPRQVAIHLARDLTGASLPTIGRAFGRNHATVLHACRRVSERLRDDHDAVDEIAALAAIASGDQTDRDY